MPGIVQSQASRPDIPVAAATPMTAMLGGPMLSGDVLAVFSSAMLLGVDAPGGPRVLAVLAREASAVPNGVRLPLSAADRPFTDDTVGGPVLVGGGGVMLAGRRLHLVRAWRSAVRPITPDPRAGEILAHAADTADRGVDATAVDRLRLALTDGDPGSLRAAADALLGLGDGLTPGGDDVLAGLLAGSHALGRTALVEQIGAAITARLAERTTAPSAELLRLALAGHACLEALAVLAAADRCGTRGDLPRAVDRLLAVGHTSGADLATGLALALLTPYRPPTRRARPTRFISGPPRALRPSKEPTG